MRLPRRISLGTEGSREPTPRRRFGVKSLGLIADSRCMYFEPKPPINRDFESRRRCSANEGSDRSAPSICQVLSDSRLIRFGTRFPLR